MERQKYDTEQMDQKFAVSTDLDIKWILGSFWLPKNAFVSDVLMIPI